MKKTKKYKSLALILGLVMILQCLSLFSVYAEEESIEELPYEFTIPTEIISEENIELYGHKERFHKAEEGMNEVHILNEDGTVSAYMFDYSVKYYDDDGLVKDKSNKLYESKRNNYLYVNDDNDVKTYFPKKITKKPIIIEADTFSMEIGIVSDSKYSKKGELTEDNYVFYNQAFGKDTAIQYTPTFNGYKEDIILYNENAPKQYSFEIKCDRLYIEKHDGELWFISQLTDAVIFKMDPFYIYDSSENVNSYTETEYTITKTDDYKYLLTVDIDQNYLDTKGLTYPVYIDPALKYNDINYIEDAPIYSAYPNTNYGSSLLAYLGQHSIYGTSRLLLRFSQFEEQSFFNTLASNNIINARVYLYNYASGSSSATAYVRQSTASPTWTESTVTWNNIGNSTGSSTYYGFGFLSSSLTQYIYIDITKIIKEWRTDKSLASRGLVVRLSDETNTEYAKCIYTKNVASSYSPYIVVNYTQIIPDGTYYIQNRRAKLFMGIENNSTTIGAAMELQGFSTGNQLKWEIKRQEDGYYSIKSVHSGKYVGVQSDITLNNTAIMQAQSYSGDGTRWTISISSSGNYIFTPRTGNDTNRVLAVPNDNLVAGSNLIQFTYADDYNYKDEWIVLSTDTNLGTLNVWDIMNTNDNSIVSNVVGFWPYSPLIYVDMEEGINSSFKTMIISSLQNAISEWNSALGLEITLIENEKYADITFRGVTEEGYDGTWPDGWFGYADLTDSTISMYSATYNGASKSVQEITASIVYILCEDGVNSWNLDNTVIHELGHALGFLGHTSNSSDVMYPLRTVLRMLSAIDKNNLSQIYNLVEEKTARS